MMKWSNVCVPKGYGGLGILNTRVLNEALLLKWVWRIYNAGEDDMCCAILKAKYLTSSEMANSRKGLGSQFWKGVQKVRDKFYLGMPFLVGNGEKIRFWIDTWLGDIPLKLRFPRIFARCRDPNIMMICDYWDGEEWGMDFRTTFGPTELAEWEELLDQLSNTQLNNADDKAVWKLEGKGGYTTKSMYKFLLFGGVIDRRAEKVWKN